MLNFSEQIKKIESIIENNNKIVKKGSTDSLMKKYFFISKDMENFIKGVVQDNQNEFINGLKTKKKIILLDLFAGGGVFSLIFLKCLFEIIKDAKISIEDYKIYFNDILINNYDLIDSDKLKANYKEIVSNFSRFDNQKISISNIDIKNIPDDQLDLLKNEIVHDSHFIIMVANPLISSNQTYKNISFANEENLLTNNGFIKIKDSLITESDYFIYLIKGNNSNLNLEKHQNKKVYINDYHDIIISEKDKERYELFNFDDIEEMKQQNFWKFTKNNKENHNTVIVFKKSSTQETLTLKYAYQKINNSREVRILTEKIKSVKEKINQLSIEKINQKYNDYKEKL